MRDNQRVGSTVRSNQKESYLDVQRGVVNLLELRPIMKLVLVPEPLVLGDIEIVHAWLPNLLVGRTAANNLALVTIIESKVEITEPRCAVKSSPHVRKEGGQGGNVDCVSDLILEKGVVRIHKVEGSCR